MITLKDFLNQNKISLNVFYEISLKICDLLYEVNLNQIIYKNLNTSNIYLSNDNQLFLENKNIIEDLKYKSPEFFNKEDETLQSVFYSFGVLLYEILINYEILKDFDLLDIASFHRTKNFDLSLIENENLKNIIKKLTEKNPEDRYENIISIKSDLSKALEGKEINQKNFSYNNFKKHKTVYGREKEIEEILSFIKNKNYLKIISIGGVSGVGKTTFINELSKKENFNFTFGKFDQFNINSPFSAFITSISFLLKKILTLPADELNIWKDNIKKTLGNYDNTILNLLPELRIILQIEKDSIKIENENFNKLYFSFQKLIKLFSQNNNSLFLFLDDLQWADSNSLN
jgi:serine/threonine protein kinase